MSIPDRTVEQRMEALEIANTVRMDRARLKRQIKKGEVDPAKAAEETDVPISAWDFVMAVPGIGKTRARKIITDSGIHPNLYLRTRPSSHRQRFADLIRQYAKRSSRLAA